MSLTITDIFLGESRAGINIQQIDVASIRTGNRWHVYSGSLFVWQKPSQHFNTISDENVYVLSFAIEPNERIRSKAEQ